MLVGRRLTALHSQSVEPVEPVVRAQSKPKAPTNAARPNTSAPIVTRFAGLPDCVAGAEVPEVVPLEDGAAAGVIVPVAGVLSPPLLPVVDVVVKTSVLTLPEAAKTV